MATAKAQTLKAPFPAFGGKSAVGDVIWSRFGDCRNYVEPFCNSCAVLLARPMPFEGTETVNDYDGLIANFWRAVQHDPDAVAFHADWPVNENDLHARHAWLVGRKDSLQARLEGCPDFFDAKVAGWWCWGSCCWIGSGWCSGKGPWRVKEVDGARQLVHLGDAGRGVNRKRVHLGNAGRGVNRKRVHLGNAGHGDEPEACGTTRKLPHMNNHGSPARGIAGANEGVYAWMQALADRLARVRVCCGDWSRVCGPTPTVKQGLTAIFLDPPYSDLGNRTSDLYRVDSLDVAHAVREWCIEHQDEKRLRICLAGYDSEHELPGWKCYEWKARGGYGSQGEGDNENAKKERLWFSPHCVKPAAERMLF